MRVIVFFTSLFFVLSCKPNLGPQSAVVSGIVPERIGSLEENPPLNFGLVEFTERGFVRYRLVLSLDYLPPEANATGTLPKCHAALKDDVVLGKLVCETGNSSYVSVTAGNVDQECYTSPKYPVTRATKALNLMGCAKARLLGFRFNPELRVDIERR